MSKRIWIAWENHRRNQSLSKEIGAKLFQLEVDYHPLIRYPLLLSKSISIIIREKPNLIFVQNPSAVLSLIVVILGKILKKNVIVDAHNAGILFLEHSNKLVRWFVQLVNNIIINKAALTIVTNSNLEKYVKQINGRPYILPDPFPIFADYKRLRLKGVKNIFYICTFSDDEPYLEVFKAAEYLDKNIYIYVSGNDKSKSFSNNIAPNIILTGHIPDTEFINYLYSVDIIIDLTFREDCLVCGAYEAVAVEKPLILSKKLALINYFDDGALYTDNTSSDIVSKINEAIKNTSLLTSNIKKLKYRRIKDWDKRKENLEDTLNKLVKN